jgi:hypothetical protein
MKAGSRASTSQRDDPPDLAQRQPYPAGLRHEGQHVEYVGGVAPVAR